MKTRILLFGLALLLVIVISPNAYAMEYNVEDLPKYIETDTYRYYLLKSNSDKLYLYEFSYNEPFKINSYIDGRGVVNVKSDIVYNYVRYQLIDNVWTQQVFKNDTSSVTCGLLGDLHYNNFDIYDEEGNLLFVSSSATQGVSALEHSYEITRSEMTKLKEPIRILLFVGLGIMAIFIVVGLIPRIIHKFM